MLFKSTHGQKSITSEALGEKAINRQKVVRVAQQISNDSTFQVMMSSLWSFEPLFN